MIGRRGDRLVEAGEVTEGGGVLKARSVTAQDSLGDFLGTSAALARCVQGLCKGGGAGWPFQSGAAELH